jgi:hypothetical protein
MIDWQKKRELQIAMNKIRTYERIGKSHATLLRGYTTDFLLVVCFGMLIDGVFNKNLYRTFVFEISRQ